MGTKKKAIAVRSVTPDTNSIRQLQEQQIELAKQQGSNLNRLMSGIEGMAKKYFEVAAETERQKTHREADANKHEYRLIMGVIIGALVFGIAGFIAAIWLNEGHYIATVVSSFFSFLGGFGFGRKESSSASIHHKAD